MTKTNEPLGSLDRRTFLTLASGAVGVLAAGGLSFDAHAAELDPFPFRLGVASGQPDHHSVVLWTRLVADPLDAETGGIPPMPLDVQWEVARDDRFREIIARGTVTALPESAHAVHVLAKDLLPNSWYFYRFRFGEAFSRTGRTRTLPAPGVLPDRMRFAFVSCQAWGAGGNGNYPSYRDLCDQDLDFVIHLGDYIYETNDGSLAEFRRLHSLYKTSPQLREAHARFPFFVTWDDHEVKNNYADENGASPDGRPFLERRANGYQAYYEHLPLRPEQKPVGPDMLLYNRFTFGKLASFHILDTRQYRSVQAYGGRHEPDAVVWDPDRTMTGAEQERWLLDGLRKSQARWNVIPQQLVMGGLDYDLGPGKSVSMDAWDGYPASRARILDFIAANRVSNPVVLSGDSHKNWVNDLKLDFDDPSSPVVATEFAGTSISTNSNNEEEIRAALAVNPHVKFFNGDYRGYVMCEVTPERWRSDLRIVLQPAVAAAPAFTLAAFEVLDGVPGAQRIDGAGDGIVGRLADRDTGAPLANVAVTLTAADGAELVGTTTDPSGEFLAFVPPGEYGVAVNGVGYEPVALIASVRQGAPTRLDLELARAGVFVGTGRQVPGPLSEAMATDIVLSNSMIAMAVSNGSQDPQLNPTTMGKPRDLAGIGHLDQLDFINLPYCSSSRPTVLLEKTVRFTRLESLTGNSVSFRGASTQAALTKIEILNTYSIEQDQPWITAETVFTNTDTFSRTFWVGDGLDHDTSGQRSGVAGHGIITVPLARAMQLTPTEPWIGMIGNDNQTYGLIYDQPGFTALACGIWVMSQRQVTLAPGESFALRRRIVAIDSGSGADPFAILSGL